MRYETILLDIDETILDFKKAEAISFESVHKHFNIEYTHEDFLTYKRINASLWKKFESNLITVREIINTRFNLYVKDRGFNVSGEKFTEYYEGSLEECAFFYDENIIDTILTLKKHSKIYCVTNGSKYVQLSRLKKSGLYDLLDGCFVSELIGLSKPSKEYFDYVKNKTSLDERTTLVVGDSLTADMPSKHYGYDVCWVNRKLQKNDSNIKIDYEITRFDNILKVLEIE